MREIPHSPVALYEVAHLFGTLIAETILASVHVRARKQAGHMGASDLIKALQNTLRGGGRPHTGECNMTTSGDGIETYMLTLFSPEDVAAFRDIGQQSDQSTAIMATAFIDDLLTLLIGKKLLLNPEILKSSIFGGYGPLSTFRAKID